MQNYWDSKEAKDPEEERKFDKASYLKNWATSID